MIIKFLDKLNIFLKNNDLNIMYIIIIIMIFGILMGLLLDFLSTI